MKMRNICNRVSLLILSFYALCAFGQTNNYKPSLPQMPYLSPEAASLGRYGEIPVSEYTGVPNISIPLHATKIGELELPLSLNYHASGVKVAQEATWVGLGWDLTIGGCINQVLSGSYDKMYPMNAPKDNWERFFAQSSVPFTTFGDNSQWGGVEENPHTLIYKMPLYQDLMYGMGEPDLFQANFCGHSLTFCVHPHTQKPMIVGDDKSYYKIEALDSYNNSWKITDGNGVQYSFEQDGTEKATTQNQSNITSWFLTQVVHPQKGKIVLSYETAGNLQMKLQPYLYQEYRKAEYDCNILRTGEQSAGSPNNEFFGLKDYLMFDKAVLYKKYLKSITTNLERIDFYKSNREDIGGYSKKLDSIVVTSLYHNEAIKRIAFQYSYYIGQKVGGDYVADKFHTTADGFRYKRLKLNGITVNGLPYKFDYNSMNLPYKTSYAADFWGYYNGIENRSFLCAANLNERSVSSAFLDLGDANRYVAPAKLQAGILTRITYPTKGYTQFEYEPNTFIDNYVWCPSADRVTTPSGVPYRKTLHAFDCKTSQENRKLTFTLTQETKVTATFSVNSLNYYYADLANATASLVKGDGTGVKKYYKIPVELMGEKKKSYEFKEELILPAATYVINCYYPPDKYATSDYASVSQLIVSYLETPTPSATVTKPAFSYGGGLRIASVSQYESNGVLLRKQAYDYSDEKGNTTGKLLLPMPKVNDDILYVGVENVATNLNGFITRTSALDRWETHVLSSLVKVPALTSLFGTPVGYSRVTLKEVNNNIANGATISLYANMPATHYFFDTYLFPNYENGTLTERRQIDAKGRIVRKQEWIYAMEGRTVMLNAFAKDLAMGIANSFDFIGLKRYRIQAYPFIVKWNKLAEERTTDFFYKGDVSTQVSNSIQYTYNAKNHLPSAIKYSTSASNETLETQIRYADSFPEELLSDYLFSKNMINYPLETLELRNKVTMSKSRNNYTLFNNRLCLSNCSWAKGDNPYEKRMEYTKYDTDGNLLEMIRSDKVKVSYLWSYNNQLPVAQIEGVGYDAVSAALTPNYVAALKLRLNGLPQLNQMLTKFPKGLFTGYTYLPLIGVSGVLRPNGDTYSYRYDNYGRLKEVSDIKGKLIEKYDYNYKH